MSWVFLRTITVFVILFGTGIADERAPKINPISFPRDLEVGKRARVLCFTYLGEEPLDFNWFKDGHKLTIGSIHQTNPTTSQLILEPLTIDHIGNYTCVVKNKYGSDEVSATLFVQAPPMWVKEPRNVKVGVGGRISVDCQALGSPVVKIMWKRRSPIMGDLVDVVRSQRVQMLSNNTLVITNAQKSEEGSYTCEASNGFKDGISKSILITVYDRPRVHRLTEYVTTERGSPVALSCSATGDEPLTLDWIKSRKSLKEWPDMFNRITFSEDKEVNSTRFTLTIAVTDLSDEGLYVCSAENEFGADEKEIRLVLVERPEVPEVIEVADVWSRSARISWSVPSSGNSPILRYVVEYWSVAGIHQNETVSSTTTSCILRDLHPFTIYKFQLWSVNSIGTSDPSEQMQFMTAKEEPSAPPTDLQIEGTGSSFVRLSWKPPPPEDWNGAITGYYIGYKQSSSALPYTFNTLESKEEDIHYVLRGLRRATSYTISVKAYNDIGSGPQSQELSFRTHSHEPPPRPSLMVRSIGSTHIQLQWFVDDELRSAINAYTLSYRKELGKWQDIMIPDADQSTFSITNLDSGVTYQAYMTSESSLGTSEPSDTVTVQTMAETIIHPVISTASESGMDEFTQTLYLVVPIAVSTVIIVTVIVIACVYVYSRRPASFCQPHGELQPDKGFTYMSTIPRRRDPQVPMCVVDLTKQGSPYSTVPLTRFEPEDDEPIYESVMEEIRSKIKQRAYEEERKIGCGTIV